MGPTELISYDDLVYPGTKELFRVLPYVLKTLWLLTYRVRAPNEPVHQMSHLTTLNTQKR
jgi:hypothetical protein